MSVFQKYQLHGAPVQIVASLGLAFLLFWILNWLLPLLDLGEFYLILLAKLSLPWNPILFLTQPWSLITAPWLVYSPNLLNFIIRLVIIYQFGNMMLTLRRNSTVWFLFVGGGIFAGLISLILSVACMPLFVLDGFTAGAGAGVLALAAAAGALMPEMNIQLFLLGNIRLKWIVIVFIIWDIIALGTPSWITVSHSAGALFGLFYSLQYKKGKDWEINPFTQIQSILKKPIRKSGFTFTEKPQPQRKGRVSEAELDELLDKVARKGYAALSRYEKERLEQASRQDL